MCFNPRARTGRDFKGGMEPLEGGSFNPRARTGRDSGAAMTLTPAERFNPRARTGRDPLEYQMEKLLHTFQSTRPHGARQKTIWR